MKYIINNKCSYIYIYFIFCCWATDSPTKTRHSNFKMFFLLCTLSTKIFSRRKYIETSSKLGHLRVITNLFGFSKRSICHRSPLPGASAKLKSQHRDFVLVVCIYVLHHFWWLVWTSKLCMLNSSNHFWLPFDLIFIQQGLCCVDGLADLLALLRQDEKHWIPMLLWMPVPPGSPMTWSPQTMTCL